MKKSLSFIIALMFCYVAIGQEISATVSVNAQQTGKTQLSIFKTLQQSLERFINETSWSDRDLPDDQRVNCSFFITVQRYESNSFKATLQVRSSRPVFGSSMTTPVFNFKDNDFNFSYTEFQPLEFNPNNFESNLVSTISFYVYVILGLDADTFSPDGGTPYFAQADQIANIAQQSGRAGWGASAGNTSRFALNRQLNSSNFSDYHQALYVYHRLGLDVMHKDVTKGKENIARAIGLLDKVYSSRSNTVLIRSFFDAKAREVASIFSEGPALEDGNVAEDLYEMAPNYGQLWSQLQ